MSQSPLPSGPAPELRTINTMTIRGPLRESWLRHPLDMFELIYVRAGRGRMVLDEQTAFTLAPGRCLLVLPHQTHVTHLGPRQTFTCVDVHFRAGRLAAALEAIDQARLFACRRAESARLGELLAAMLAEADGARVGADIVANALLAQLLVHAVRIAGGSAGGGPRTPHAADSAERIALAAQHHIRDHFAEPLTLEAVARAVHVSPFHLSHLFSDYFGHTLSAYLIRTRLDRARELLRDSTLKVQDIAARVGFSDPRYFARVFRHHFDMTPTQLRGRGDGPAG